MKSVFQALPRARSSKVAASERIEDKEESLKTLKIQSNNELEAKYSKSSLLNVYDFPPAHSSDFLVLYQIPSFGRRYEETYLDILLNLTNSIDNITERIYYCSMFLTEMNFYGWLAVESLNVIDSKEVSSPIEKFKMNCRRETAMLTQSSISIENMVTSLKEKIMKHSDMIWYCSRMCKNDYYKQIRDAKLLFGKYLRNQDSKEINYQGCADVVGKINICCKNPSGCSILYCKKGDRQTWVNITGIPKVTLEELVLSTMAESQERVARLQMEFPKLFETVTRSQKYNLNAGDTSENPTLQISVDKLMRLLQFRKLPLDETPSTQILYSYMKLKKKLKTLAILLGKVKATSTNLKERWAKIEKKFRREKFFMKKNRYPFFIGEFTTSTESSQRLFPIGLLTVWPEILTDFILPPTNETNSSVS